MAVPISLFAQHEKLDIQPADSIVYKVEFPGPGNLESWYVPISISNGISSIDEVKVVFKSGALVKKKMIIEAKALGSMISYDSDKSSGSLAMIFHEPAKLEVDMIRFIFSIKNGLKEEFFIKIEEYQQKNSYIFPLKGNALLTAGFFNSGGHLSRATQFAVDAIGLNETYAPMLNATDETNKNMAGWGRVIIAPSDGEVVFVEKGIPDQPYGQYDEKSYTLPDGRTAGWGNCVVIDHGHGEYSVLMHMRKGSVTVDKGQVVRQGQKVGELGNSGDSFGPHLHFHLQKGPKPIEYQGLPVTFENLNVRYLRKGEYLTIDG